MTTQELNIANALNDSTEVLKQMISKGMNNAKYIYGLSSMLIEKYNLTRDQSVIVIENALKIA